MPAQHPRRATSWLGGAKHRWVSPHLQRRVHCDKVTFLIVDILFPFCKKAFCYVCQFTHFLRLVVVVVVALAALCSNRKQVCSTHFVNSKRQHDDKRKKTPTGEEETNWVSQSQLCFVSLAHLLPAKTAFEARVLTAGFLLNHKKPKAWKQGVWFSPFTNAFAVLNSQQSIWRPFTAASQTRR